jgi:hypothetical protein
LRWLHSGVGGGCLAEAEETESKTEAEKEAKRTILSDDGNLLEGFGNFEILGASTMFLGSFSWI